MAREVVTRCDRCGKKCSVLGSRKITFIKYFWLAWIGSNSHNETNHDLCPDCAVELDKFLEGKATDTVVKG